VNVSDLEAMGARATALVVGFLGPPSLELSWALEFAAGV
jgi:thiamine-monophosphate kinase